MRSHFLVGKLGSRNRFNHTSLVNVSGKTVGPKSLCNRTFFWRSFDITVGVRAFVIGLSQISSFLSLWSYEFEPSEHFILLVKRLLPTKIWCFVWPRITAEVSYGHEFESPQWISLGAMVVYLVWSGLVWSGLVWSRISVIMGLSVKYSIGQRVCCFFSFSAVFQTIWTIFTLCKLGVGHTKILDHWWVRYCPWRGIPIFESPTSSVRLHINVQPIYNWNIVECDKCTIHGHKKVTDEYSIFKMRIRCIILLTDICLLK